MPAINTADSHVDASSFEVRQPQQRRTREQWMRVLDAGLGLLRDAGYDGFTILALCERASVPPRALYARVDTKDALFLAVYEHGIAKVVADHAVFGQMEVWAGLTGRQRIAKAVRTVSSIFRTHREFLRAVVLISGAHPEVARRGARYRAELAELFGSVLDPLDQRTDDGLASASAFAFTLVFSTFVVDTAYGPLFGGIDEDELVRAVERYLLGRPDDRSGQ